jgi:hypothetical protein
VLGDVELDFDLCLFEIKSQSCLFRENVSSPLEIADFAACQGWGEEREERVGRGGRLTRKRTSDNEIRNIKMKIFALAPKEDWWSVLLLGSQCHPEEA